MTDFLVKCFVKEYQYTKKMSVRTSYGILAGVVGIFCNLLLFIVKFIVGIIVHSISVTADAFNNLSDAGSSIVSLIGVRLAAKPPDKEHPFGHGRVEYIAALIVAFIIMEVGFTFLKDAIGRLTDKGQAQPELFSVVILVLSIGVKLWLSFFNRSLGRRIDSQVLRAAAVDAISDVMITAVTIVSLFCGDIGGVSVDAAAAIVVALAVMWAGFGVAKNTLEPLIGEATTMETYQMITDFVEKYEGVIGSHDLIVHNYGPGRSMASIHAEVPNDVDIEVSHEVIDRIERDAQEELNFFLVIHMDPIEMKNRVTMETRARVENVIWDIKEEIGIHDFRMVEGRDRINLIFDLVVPYAYAEVDEEKIKNRVIEKIREIDPRFECVITIEKSFVADTKEE